MRSWLLLPVAVALAVLSQYSCAPTPSDSVGRGVLVIAVDALRYDHLGVAGYDRPTSPALDALAREGVFFSSAYAAAPCQVPAHMALISSSDPRLARRVIPADVPASQATTWHLPDDALRPAAEFLRDGFSTALFYDHPNMAPLYGYQRGFELYQGPRSDRGSTGTSHGSEAVFHRFQQWIARAPKSKKWFAYLELADLENVWTRPNSPWDKFFAPRPELSRVPPVGDAQHVFFAIPRSRWSLGMSTLGEYEARYDGAIARLDDTFAKLRVRLAELGRWENTTIVVVGSYGMSFGESGLMLDSGTFSDVDLHVPLIVRPARLKQEPQGSPDKASVSRPEELGTLWQPGLRSRALVSTIDVLPTMLDICGLGPVGVDGISFAKALNGEDNRARREVQASCALQAGYATLNANFCFERVWPGRVQDTHLRLSWYGDSELHQDEVREVLHDRSADHAVEGHVRLNSADSPMAKSLAESGAAWAAKVEGRRAALQHERPGSVEDGAKKSDGR